MISKIRRKFSLFAILSVFIFLSLILLTINIVNFSLVASDADRITSNIQANGGHYVSEHIPAPGEDKGRPGQDQMGPDSPEMKDSLRYFTVSFDENNEPKIVEYKINYFSKEEAIDLAKELKKQSTGWTQRVYRYRVWKSEDKITKYVTVIDQGRELTPTYNVLYTSLIGGGVGLAITIIGIYLASKFLVKPIEYTDNKQRRFIANASIALRTPISIISFDNATLAKENGNQEANKSIDHQLKKLLDLADDLNAFSLIASSKSDFGLINVSNVAKEIINRYLNAFSSNHKELITNIEDDISFNVDLGMMQKLLSEIIENCLKYSDSRVEVNISKENERLIMEFKNDCKGIPDGTLDRVFDRFYRLDYKDHSIYEGNGMGLAIVKDIVDKHKGRAIAKGENGYFVLKIEL